ncbi:MAG: Gmad2 immunoglobulin-like domain-containing protein [Candidatus Paceibacterota bacterium]
MNKKLIFIIVIILILGGVILSLRLLNGGEDNWICVKDQWVKHGNPSSPQPTTGCGQEIIKGFSNDKIKLDNLKSNDEISSPLTITGKIKGTWFFEGSFPVILVDWDGKIIAQVPATAKSDWMTEDFVPFEAIINFQKPSYGEKGSLIFKKDNPSGLPQNDDAIEIPVVFK